MENEKTLSAQEALWAKQLKIAWGSKKRELGLTQEAAAARMGWNSQATVAKYLNGFIPLNLQAKLKFSSLLGMEPVDIWPDFQPLPQSVMDTISPRHENDPVKPALSPLEQKYNRASFDVREAIDSILRLQPAEADKLAATIRVVLAKYHH